MTEWTNERIKKKKECMEGGTDGRMEEWTDGSVDQSINQSINQSVNQSIIQSIIQSINQSINQSMELATDTDKNKEVEREYCTGFD